MRHYTRPVPTEKRGAAQIEIIIGPEWHTKEITPQHLKKRPFGGILIPPGSNRERLDLAPSIKCESYRCQVAP